MESSFSLGPVAAKTEPLTFGRLLRAMRETSGLTQRQLVDAAAGADTERLSGLVVTALSHWEDDRRVPLPPQLLALTRVLRTKAVEQADGEKAAAGFRDDVVTLITLARDHRYAGIVSTWIASRLDPEACLRSWEVYAGTFPLRPPRGRGWDPLPSEEGIQEADATLALPPRTDARRG